MKLARIIYQDGIPWCLSDDSLINPPIGTIVQYEIVSIKSYEVYFPGCSVGCSVDWSLFCVYFEPL